MANYITTHEETTHASIFSASSITARPTQQIGPAKIETIYTLATYPADLTNSQDITDFTTRSSQAENLAPPALAVMLGGIPPGTETDMHRTPTVNIGIVLEGTMELELDSGEKRVLKVGDSYVQRATAHRWRNRGEGWCRTFTVTVPAVGVEGMGERSWVQTLRETMEGVEREGRRE